MTARVAADYADVSPWTIRRHVRACGRRGRAFVYSIEELERWMRGHPIASSAVLGQDTPRHEPAPADASIKRIRSLARGAGAETRSELLAIDESKVAS